MAKHLDLGQRGEDLAQAFLKEKSYEILDTNWRYSRAEIDIVARHEEQLIIVEVKTRATYRHGYPEDDVDHRKQQLLYDAATAYMDQINHGGEVRFDILSVVIRPDGTHDIRHLQDAFFPGLF